MAKDKTAEIAEIMTSLKKEDRTKINNLYLIRLSKKPNLTDNQRTSMYYDTIQSYISKK